MRVELGLGVAAKPSLRQLHERVRSVIGLVSAGGGALSFLQDQERLMDLPLDVDGGLFVIDIAIPRDSQQLQLLPRNPRARRGARLLDRDDVLDQQLVDEIASRLKNVADAERKVAALSNTKPAAGLVSAVREVEDSTGIDTAVLRSDIVHRKEPVRVRLPDQTAFEFPAPPTVRRTCGRGVAGRAHLQPSGWRNAV